MGWREAFSAKTRWNSPEWDDEATEQYAAEEAVCCQGQRSGSLDREPAGCRGLHGNPDKELAGGAAQEAQAVRAGYHSVQAQHRRAGEI